jgi:shikimate dehydrogenase
MPGLTRVGLLGWPLGHSVSPAMHNAAFEALCMAGHYEALPAPPDRLADAVRSLAARGYRGANVTIPHKQAVMPLLDGLSDAARAIGAINTIIVTRSPEAVAPSKVGDDFPDRPTQTILRGDNTDWLGFLHPLDEGGFDLAGASVLLLGAGGAARAVVYALAQRGVGQITILNRTPAHARDLAVHAHALGVTNCQPLHVRRSAAQVQVLAIANWQLPIDLVVNTTPAGMWPHVDESPWPAELPFPPGALAYDLVYRPERTRFLQQAEAAGCATQGGLEMLVVQGAAAFELWTGREPPVDVMLAAARSMLEAERRV